MNLSLETNKELRSRAKQVFPGGVNSPIRSWKSVGGCPFIVQRGEQDLLVDVEGNTYIDYCLSFGALILGHAHPKVVSSSFSAIRRGSTYGLTTEWEVELGELIAQHTCVEKLRFVSSGTEALTTAIRLARGFTKRSIIIKFDGNYHGHIDCLLKKAGSFASKMDSSMLSFGIPKEALEHTISLPYNDIEALDKVLKNPLVAENTALILLEPVAGNMGVVPASKAFLQYVRAITKKIGALLCFDEVISGFRVHFGGASALFRIQPDLVAYGKILGGGFPAAAIGGAKEIMDSLAPLGNVFQAGTLSGNPVAMAAGLTVMKELLQKGFYEDLQKKTAQLLDPIEQAMKNTEHSIQRVGSMFSLFFHEKHPEKQPVFSLKSARTYEKFFRALLKEGIYFPPGAMEAAFVSFAHTEEHIFKTRDAILRFLQEE